MMTGVSMDSQATNAEAPPRPAGFVSPKTVALYAVLTALTTAVTMVLVIPLPTRGYFNLGEAMVFFTAFTFGRRAGMICGGVGSAAADLLLGFGFFAPITLIAKGTEGWVAGLFGESALKGKAWLRVVGIWLGGACMVASYFIGEWILFGLGYALFELPFNIGQVLVGGVIGLVLAQAVSIYLHPTPKTE